MKIEYSGFIALMICGLVGFGAYVYEQNRETLFAARQAALTDSVKTLPPGVEDAWLSYADRRVAATIKREGNLVKVVQIENNTIGSENIISINTPFEISCNAVFGASVQFGYGDEAVIASVIDPFGTTKTEAIDSSAEAQPFLGVSPTSIAANTLANDVCRRIATDVSDSISEDDLADEANDFSAPEIIIKEIRKQNVGTPDNSDAIQALKSKGFSDGEIALYLLWLRDKMWDAGAPADLTKRYFAPAFQFLENDMPSKR